MNAAPAEPAPYAPTFLRFCADCRVRLTPAQDEIAAVLFDGEEPPRGSLFFGGHARIPEKARRVVAGMCGGRAGKSYILVGLRALWGALTRSLATLAPGEMASSLIVAPDLRLARQSLRYAHGAAVALGVPILADDKDGFVVHRSSGDVRIEVLPATRGGSAVRARSLTDAFLDEAAFFRDENSVVNDQEIFDAVAPRVMLGGQIVMVSTAWAELGLHWDAWSSNLADPQTAIALHATTEQMRPEMAAIVLLERERDPETAAREFDAVPMAAGGGVFFDQALIRACLDESLEEGEASEPGDMVVAGGDFAFESNSSALAICHLRKGRVRLAELIELLPEPGKPLRPSATVAAFADRILWHGGNFMMADAHYRQTVCEIIADKGIGFAEAPRQPSDAYVRTRTLMREGLVGIPNHPMLLAQLRETIARPKPGGGLTLILPKHRRRKPGQTSGVESHGDLVSAFVLAVYQAAGAMVKADAPEPGTREAAEIEATRLREARRKAGAYQAELAREAKLKPALRGDAKAWRAPDEGGARDRLAARWGKR